MSTLAAHIDATPLADTHEHLAPEPTYVALKPDVFFDLFSWCYIPADLVVAGAAQETIDRITGPCDDDVAERFRAIEPYWRFAKHTGYGEAVRLTAKIVFDIDDINAETLIAAAPRAAALRRPGEQLRLLRDVANIEYVQINNNITQEGWAYPPDPAGPEFFLGDITWQRLASGTVDLRVFSEQMNVDICDARTLRRAMGAVFDKHAACAIAVKTQHAYDRTLQWRERSDADAERVIQKLLRGEECSAQDRLCLGDWCWARGVELTIEHKLPFKHHTGYHAGHSGMNLEQTRPEHLCPLLIKYPQARFALMHCAHPFGGELRAIAKHFPNVWIDCCWSWSIDPPGTADFVRRAIHSVPINKLFAFGGDSAQPAASVGYAAQCRRWLTRALQAEIDEGLLSEQEAMDVASRVMRLNQAEFFDLEGTRKAIRAALAAGAA